MVVINAQGLLVAERRRRKYTAGKLKRDEDLIKGASQF